MPINPTAIAMSSGLLAISLALKTGIAYDGTDCFTGNLRRGRNINLSWNYFGMIDIPSIALR
jgi:hypothetical protein